MKSVFILDEWLGLWSYGINKNINAKVGPLSKTIVWSYTNTLGQDILLSIFCTSDIDVKFVVLFNKPTNLEDNVNVLNNNISMDGIASNQTKVYLIKPYGNVTIVCINNNFSAVDVTLSIVEATKRR